MRPRALMLVLVAMLATAGCFGNGEDADPPASTTPVGTPDTTPPSVTTPETTTPAPTEPTPPPAPPSPPAPLPPKVIYNKSFDFAQGDATGQSPKVETSQAVAKGYGNVTVNVTLERGSAAPTPLPVSGAVNSPRVRVLDPTGTEVLVVEEEEGAAELRSFPTTEGAWTVRYEGAGTLRALVTLTAIP